MQDGPAIQPDSGNRRPGLKTGIWAAIAALFLLVVGFLGWQYVVQGTDQSLTASMKLGTGFSLVDHNGAPITQAAFAGKPTLLYFGFTRCPEVCPTTLYEMAGWLDALGEEGRDLQAFFISVDPERDTPEIMKGYSEAFTDRVVGITGDPDEVAKVVAAWHVYAAKVPTDDGDYTMDHTASVFLIDRNGVFKGTIAYGESPETAIAKLRRLAAPA
ncbi:SCO family protein [Hoeflea alexandrii]|uniref:SCO family protein n=1 Tax=Hoeflea alexandrii TaxID=288436 RepID=UPI0022AFDFAB|nr:SCO family protein [Hoeflea alexandrii]MCZ4288244.1 SCO family protein [Hoeflea alexandrii]